jgi:hypothetical protein
MVFGYFLPTDRRSDLNRAAPSRSEGEAHGWAEGQEKVTRAKARNALALVLLLLPKNKVTGLTSFAVVKRFRLRGNDEQVQRASAKSGCEEQDQMDDQLRC